MKLQNPQGGIEVVSTTSDGPVDEKSTDVGVKGR